MTIFCAYQDFTRRLPMAPRRDDVSREHRSRMGKLQQELMEQASDQHRGQGRFREADGGGAEPEVEVE